MVRVMFLMSLGLMLLLTSCGGGGGIEGPGPAPTKAPQVAGEVDARGASSLRGTSQVDDLYVRVVVTNPNPDQTDVAKIRYLVKFDPEENAPLTETEAATYLKGNPGTLPASLDMQEVAYTGSPQIIEINSFKGNALSPNERYWISAVFVSSQDESGPVTRPQRFKLIFRYQLVDPPDIGILKTFEGTIKDHEYNVLPNTFVQYFHEGVFLEATVSEDDGTYYMEVVVPNPEGTSSVRGVSCEESEDPTGFELRAYHPYYENEVIKHLLPEYVHYYVDFMFPSEEHNEGGGVTI